jgi:hypothetical protein
MPIRVQTRGDRPSEELVLVINLSSGDVDVDVERGVLRWLPAGRHYHAVSARNTDQLYVLVHAEDPHSTQRGGLAGKLTPDGLVSESHKMTCGELEECLTTHGIAGATSIGATSIGATLVSSEFMCEAWRQVVFGEFETVGRFEYGTALGWSGCGNTWERAEERSARFAGPAWAEYNNRMFGFAHYLADTASGYPREVDPCEVDPWEIYRSGVLGPTLTVATSIFIWNRA